ncbi:gamma-tubulin complex component 6 isoform X2 [Scleropages formosus]|uniref:Gamma-tubulin complex component 6 n=1 Tax=Scleropages formosus TaxID=113540 RepID=A0A8C9VKI3_SCLFO|nr:gamma-tubulin complex component 6 isoform X2 [Scleropages formosus]
MHRHGSLGSSDAMNGGGGSITELLGALCDTCISGVSWRKRAVGATSPDTVRRALRRRAYGTLLAKLFQQESPKAPCARSAAATAAATPPRNKVLMISLDLRLSGCQEEAEKLEELLWKLGDGPASGLGELDSVLELLVQLAGSVPPPPASFNRDYMRRERPVLRRPPLTGYHSKELQQLEARAWSLVCREEWGALGAQQRTLGLMDGLPGTGLPTLGRWSDGEDRFERETRLSLFGALQNTRTTDLDIRLDLPPVPSNIEVTGLAIRVPPAFDQSEDEGFQSASNLTPDSQSEPSPSPEVDVWEALRNFEPSWRRCWENVGWPPGKKEDPYLTEAGREAFDHLYRLREGEMRVVCSDNSALPPTPQHSQKQLVADFLNVLIGVTSDTFLLNQVSVQFEVRPGVCVSGASPESISRLLAELAQYGTHYLRLSRFSLQSAHQRGLVFQAFTGGLRRYLQYYRACVLSTPPSLSLLTIGFLFRKLGRQLRYLSELCCVDGNAAVGQTPFPVGVRLLSYLYNEALSNCSNENYPVLLSLLKSSCEPYTRFVSDWVYSGVFRDVYKEFMIQVNEDYLSYRDKHFWVQGYTLISQDVEECVPVFLRHIANDVYVCGKTINLLKICCPQHYICWSELPVPRIAVTFSMQEVEEIERDCAVYRGRMERIAKHSALSREEQILHTEQARQELISHVRESTAKTLETIRGRQVSQRLAQEAKKRERFEEIKHHLEQEREWRSAAKRKEQEDDFSFARELRDREKRLRALEEQLERRTKKELIAQYSRMSEEATRRERRAVWRVQRLQLNEARTQFLEEDQRLIQVLLKMYPLGRGRKLLEYPPPSVTPQGSQVPEAPTAVYDGLQNTQDRLPATSSLPPPSLPPLHNTSICSRTSDSHILDQLDLSCFEPKSPRLSGSGQVDRALQDIGSELSEGNNTSVKDDYDFSAPYSPLQDSVARARWGPTVQPGFTCLAEQSRDPQIQGSEHLSPKAESENVPGLQTQSSEEGAVNTGDGEEPALKASLLGVQLEAPLDVSITVGDPAEVEQVPVLSTHVKSVLREEAASTSPSANGTTPGKSVEEETVDSTSSCPILNQHSDSSDCITMENRILSMETPGPGVECVDLGARVNQTPFPGSSHGHAADSFLIVGCVVSGTEPIQKVLPNRRYGNASDSTLEVGCIVSGTEPVQKSLPGSSYGHASDSTLEVGCIVSGTEPVQKSLPGSSYGHASDSTLEVGCIVSGTEPVQKSLPGSSYGHASDSTLEPGCVFSGTEPVQKSLPGSSYGHASDSTLEPGCVFSGTEPVQKPLPGSSYGHASDSTLGVGCVVSGTEPVQRPLPGSSYGHASDSTLGVGCVVSGTEPVQKPLPGSSYGHASDSTLGVGCVVSVSLIQAPLHGNAYRNSSDSALGMGRIGKGTLLNSLTESETSDTTTQKPPEDQVHEESSGNQEAKDQVFGSEAGTPDEARDLMESSSAWVKASGIQPGDRTEQDYLHSLAAQYEVEQYQDDYRILTAAPDSQLLQQVTRGPYGFPGSGGMRDATDTTAVQLSEMVSLPVLIKHSVTTPLSTHVSLVNKAVVDYFFVELGVEKHFEALRHFLLMEDGEFAQSLSDLLFEKLASGQTPGELLTPLVLNSILSKALQYSLHGGGALAANFTFALRFLPERFHPHAPDVLQCLELRYKVDWPLNIVITDNCMNKYNRLFSFLLQLKHMVWTLRDVWFHLKRAALVKGASHSTQFRQLQLYRHEMQHFVKVIQGYIANQILQVSWSEFIHKLGNVSDLDSIHHTHADYLNRAIFRGLLTEKAAPVMNIIHSIFSLILKFRAQLIAQPWSSQQGETVHPSFVAMQQSYNTFKYYSHFLFKVVTKLVNRGYQPHLEDFLLRINFNNYYKDS